METSMNKKALNTIMYVVFGIAVFVMFGTAMSLLFDAILSDDLLVVATPEANTEKVVSYIKNSAVGIVCIAIPTLVCCSLAFSAKSKKIFGILSATLALLLLSMSIGFIFDLRGTVMQFDAARKECYTIATAYFSDLIMIIVSSCIICAYFIAMTALAVRSQKTDMQPVLTDGNNDSDHAATMGE